MFPRTSIRTKLVGLTLASMVAIIAFLALYFPSRHVEALADAKHARMETYGALLGRELRSAVASSDRATAAELLRALDVDRDLAATVLFDGVGTTLFSSGAPGAWVEQARAGVAARRIFQLGDRICLVEPIAASDGARGTLVVELSNARGREQTRWTAIRAVAMAMAVMLVGGCLAWIIARSLTERLRALASVASTVTHPASRSSRANIDSHDEVGTLAAAFNSMLTELEDERVRLQQTVERLRAAEEELEARVAQRTAQLDEELTRRAQMEIDLRQAQRLESIGRLAAGIAHEINTPVQFASDSCVFLVDAGTDLVGVLGGYRELFADAVAGRLAGDALAAAVAACEEAGDVDYLVDQIPLAARRALEGLERVSSIVRALKEFSYSDRAAHAEADLNRAILGTLTVAKNEYKYVADVKVELAELPPVACSIGEINQVVLNMIVNAAHAIETAVAGTERRGLITVRTALLDEEVAIEISDDGCGIAPEHLDKIFEPFFTTKELGKGTGQGLAIAHTVIVDKHGGHIDVRSSPSGTTFTIRLPHASAARARDAA